MGVCTYNEGVSYVTYGKGWKRNLFILTLLHTHAYHPVAVENMAEALSGKWGSSKPMCCRLGLPETESEK